MISHQHLPPLWHLNPAGGFRAAGNQRGVKLLSPSVARCRGLRLLASVPEDVTESKRLRFASDLENEVCCSSLPFAIQALLCC